MTMKKEDMLRLCGSMEQLAGVRRIEYQDGRAAGLRCAAVKNGPLEYELMLDKSLDPAFITYKGINLSFLTKPGLQGRSAYDTAGEEAVRSIMGGAMFTCGLDHIHGFREVEGTLYPTHGRMRTTPAEKVCMDAAFQEDQYRIRVSAEMRQARIFGENMVLRRTVETIYGTNEIIFRDEIENQAFEPEPFCFLYHCNFGYPLLAPGSRVLLPAAAIQPRDEAAKAGIEKRCVMEDALDGAAEQVFLLTPAADEKGNTFGALINDELQLALCIRFNVGQIPYVTQWKSRASGDYAMAVEPTNAGFAGRAGKCRMLQPLEKHVNEFRFCIIEGRENIQLLESEYDKIMKRTDA